MNAKFENHLPRFAHKPGTISVSIVGGPAPNAADLAVFMGKLASTHDNQAYASLFKYYAPRVKTYLLRCGLTANVADEITQEVMILLWRKAGSFDPSRASASTWVFTIARNARIDYLRRLNALPPPPEAEIDPSLSAETLMINAESADHVRAALSSLSTEQQQIVQLFFMADTPHSAIAATLNLPLGTVKSRIRLALMRLRQLLTETEP